LLVEIRCRYSNYIPKAPTTLKADRAKVVNCILTLKIQISK
jgi:hypothetical protein